MNSVPKKLKRRCERRLVHRAIKSGVINAASVASRIVVINKLAADDNITLLSDPEEE
jgi:hypothetical protein